MDYQREFLQAVKNGQLPKVSAICANKPIDINKPDQVYLHFSLYLNYFKYTILIVLNCFILQLHNSECKPISGWGYSVIFFLLGRINRHRSRRLFGPQENDKFPTGTECHDNKKIASKFIWTIGYSLASDKQCVIRAVIYISPHSI